MSKKRYTLKFKRYGLFAILVEWPSEINTFIFSDIMGFKSEIELRSITNIKAVIPAYNSILVMYHNSETLNWQEEIKYLESYYSKKKRFENKSYRIWQIPVCYDPFFGIDLELLSIQKKISIETIIKRHYESQYLVYFKGFLPGFMYLGGLDPSLFQPRKSRPRQRIEKGAVAIGGEQSGIYPIESPGGWNIIGNTPINFFDIKKERPCFASPGDHIQFYPIDKKQHQDIKTLVNGGVYQLEFKEALKKV